MNEYTHHVLREQFCDANTYHAPPLCLRPNLLKLDDDVLSLIASHLRDTAPSYGLSEVLSLSLLCKQTRRSIMPLLFRNVRWPRWDRVEFYPPPVWPYIRQLSFVQGQWPSLHAQALKILAEIFPQLPNIITFTYAAQSLSPGLAFVSSMAQFSPSLTALEISTVFLSHDALALFATFSGLRRLLINHLGRMTLLTASESKRSQSIQCVANLVLGCRDTLNHLELPGEFCPLETFVSPKTSLPSLQTFILRGYPPLDSHNFPIWKVLRSMPRISKLEIFCRLRIIGAVSHRWVLMQEDAVPAPGEIFLFPSQLETLTISNPSLEDFIFRRLPHSLKRLFLDFIPDWENMLSSGDSLAYHRPARMLTLFRAMQEMAGSSGMMSLDELRIKMGWCVTPQILGFICQIFPGLRSLELQGLRYFNRAEEPESDMDACLDSLSQLTQIHTLKLALELREDPYEYSSNGEREVGSVDHSTRRWANALSLRLPTLKMVAFEARPHTGRGLGPRILMGPPTWVWYSAETRNSISEGRMERVLGPLERDLEVVHSLEKRWELPQAPLSYQPISKG